MRARPEARSPRLVRAALTLAFLASAALAAAELRVQPLARDGKVLVSFELTEGFTDEVRAAVSSGLPTTFTYDVELRKGVPFWLDRTIDAAVVSASVQYDNLTRRHRLSRAINGRLDPDVTISERGDFVRRWMTTFDRLPLFSTERLEANSEYYVRVRARTAPRTTWSLWPWSKGAASGHAKFTFIP